jgi:uncharacterized paraquat-inducible protein A
MINLFTRLITFSKSLLFHIWSGFPKSSQAQINARYLICLSCDSFDKQNEQCLECGCNINNKKIFMNKLAWADQQCPLNKWSKIND